uniref:Cardiotrophin-like cytokine factor 1 n=1 Tax=Sander lucioperca TaxID=283035 RepID=A0A8C9WUD4_SANLU
KNTVFYQLFIPHCSIHLSLYFLFTNDAEGRLHQSQVAVFLLTYLGPPFNEKDFSPPRPNSTALSLPSAATRLELWHGLENQARLAQNQKAYSVLLAAVRELARSTLCPALKTSLLHFCTGLDGLLGSISALMTTLGYALPPPSANMEMRPTMNDFAKKVEGFWILRELQSWLWRSAKDFNRLKKRLRG